MSKNGHIAVLGAGNMGTALAWVLARNGHPCIKIWDIFPAVVADINRTHCNSRYLPGVTLPAAIRGVISAQECVAQAAIVVIALPSPFVCGTLELVVPDLLPEAVVLSATKGLDKHQLVPIHCQMQQILGHRSLVLLAGPAIANEFSRGLPTSVIMADSALVAAKRLQAVFQNDFFRVSVIRDVMGAALGGILKNIYAILLGYLDTAGGGGRNLEAAALNAAVREMMNLAVAKGAIRETIHGLAGLGDLVATGFSEDSHNRNYGRELGRGLSLVELAAKVPLAPEGTRAVTAARAWAAEVGLAVPLANAVEGILQGGKPSPGDLLRLF